MSRPYLQHGRRHGRQGSDPIPNYGDTPVASAYTNPSGVTIAGDGASHYCSIEDGVDFAGFATSDDLVFSNGSTTLFTGSAVYGIQIDSQGTFAILLNCFTLSGGTAGKQVTGYWSASDGSAPSFFQQGRSAGIVADTWDAGQEGAGPHLFTHEWITVDDAQTGAVIAPYAMVEPGDDIVVSMQLMVVQWTGSVLAKL